MSDQVRRLDEGGMDRCPAMLSDESAVTPCGHKEYGVVVDAELRCWAVGLVEPETVAGAENVFVTDEDFDVQVAVAASAGTVTAGYLPVAARSATEDGHAGGVRVRRFGIARTSLSWGIWVSAARFCRSVNPGVASRSFRYATGTCLQRARRPM